MKSERPDFTDLVNTGVNHMNGKVDLSNQQIQVDDLPSLNTLLKINHNYIRTLDLSGNKSIAGIIPVLKDLDKLESLQLIDCGLASRDIEILSDLVRASNVLKNLDLSSNELKAKSFSVLTLALSQNSSIKTLELRNTGMSDRELKYLTDILEINNSLKSIDIRDNKLVLMANAEDLNKFISKLIFNRNISN